MQNHPTATQLALGIIDCKTWRAHERGWHLRLMQRIWIGRHLDRTRCGPWQNDHTIKFLSFGLLHTTNRLAWFNPSLVMFPKITENVAINHGRIEPLHAVLQRIVFNVCRYIV